MRGWADKKVSQTIYKLQKPLANCPQTLHGRVEGSNPLGSASEICPLGRPFRA